MASIYRNANGGDYLWYPPATFDLRLAERDGSHRYRREWRWVYEKEGSLGREADDIVSITTFDESGGEYEEEEPVKKQKIELIDVVELSSDSD